MGCYLALTGGNFSAGTSWGLPPENTEQLFFSFKMDNRIRFQIAGGSEFGYDPWGRAA